MQDLSQLLQQCINGLSIGAIYALIAVGYTMVYGVLRLINFAHGDVLMVGAMIGLYSFNSWYLAASPSLADCPPALLVAAVAVVGLAAAIMAAHWLVPAWRGAPRTAAVVRLGVTLAVLALVPFVRVAGRPVQDPPARDQPLTIFVDAGDSAATAGQLLSRPGSVADRAGGTRWSGTVDFGDGSGPKTLEIDPATRAFLLRHVYERSRLEPYEVRLTIANDRGTEASARLLLRVRRAASWVAVAGVVVLTVVLCALLGYTIERCAYRPLRGRPRIEALITAIGVSMLLEFGAQSPYICGPTPQAYPPMMPELFPVGPTDTAAKGGWLQISIGQADWVIFGTTLVLMAGLWYLVMRTRTGMALRAVSHRFDTAALMGVNVDRIISFTFMLGSSLAAIASVLVGLRVPQVDPLMGINWGLKAFVAAVLGGIGSVPGAVAGGLLLGMTETLVAGYLYNGSQYRDGVAFIVLIAVLLVKPSGLLGKSTIEKV
jgi:branched-chain amino acid transport system permease protein